MGKPNLSKNIQLDDRLTEEKARLEREIFSEPPPNCLGSLGSSMREVMADLSASPGVAADIASAARAEMETLFGKLTQL